MVILLVTYGAWIIILCLLFRYYIRRRANNQSPGKESADTITVAFFHPYCHAGGGGERVLWVAIRALQNRYENIKCIVYTADTEATPDEILDKAKATFNISLSHPVHFVYLYRKKWVEASSYPYFTLLGQSLGSLVLGFEALWKFIPDIYIDSIGYAFTLPLFRYLGGCKTACYVHYPTISTDMLKRVASRTGTYNNAGFISRSPVLSRLKLIYYNIFANLYGFVGRSCEVIMVNSSWTKGHILDLWKCPEKTFVIYPPCDIKEFMKCDLTLDFKEQSIVSVSQFRPEKDHPLQVRSFAKFLSTKKNKNDYILHLVGGCRNIDDAARVDNLRMLSRELKIEENVKLHLNVSFKELKDFLSNAVIGLHTMWNEHFGIGVVECMAAGSVVLAHKSGGPLMDIVTDYNGSSTGFLADSEESYAYCMDKIFSLSSEERLTLRKNARESVSRFSEKTFENGFLNSVAKLL